MTRSSAIPARSLRDSAVLAFAFMALASGFGQYGAVTALGDVARSFGHVTHGTSLADQAGLSGTELGLGLAVLRIASLGGLPLAALADRLGRRRVLVATCVVGLSATVLAAASPGYWWFVALFALGRPFLSATNAVAQVGAAEGTRVVHRAKAVALVTAGYGIGSGLTAVLHGIASKTLGFRGIFALAAIPLVVVIARRRRIEETGSYVAEASRRGGEPLPVFASVPAPLRRRLGVVCTLAFSVGVVTGPANSFAFVYAQNVLGLSGSTTAAMVSVAALFGLAGLLVGRFLADRFGRRPAATGAMIALILAAVLTYAGGRGAFLGGYELSIFAAASFAPAAGTLANELFPTSVRASVAGWNVAASVGGAVTGLLVFGAVADAGNRFSTGALVTFLPILATTGLFLALPETRGRELEELWPDVELPQLSDG